MTPAVQAHTEFDPTLAPLVAHMPLVSGYRESLQRLQDVWDQLTLLGQMSGIAADITTTADEFRALTGTLLNALAGSLMRNTLHRMQAQAQVAIDILVRNLFERTADVGFLATDTAVRAFLGGADDAAAETALRARFQAYAAKYSVYDDIVLLAPDGQVRARLDADVVAVRSTHPLVAQSLRPELPFVESFGAIDFLGGRRGLVYSTSIRAAGSGALLGILCLSFRFDDEMDSIFKHLAPVGPCSVVVLCDADDRVIASSDGWHIPVGARLASTSGREQRIFFAGREMLVAAVSATGYQGYAGPGWTARTLVPVDQAFRADGDAGVGDTFPAGTLNTSSLVADDLRSIPLQARHIQRGLERSVWNGEVRGRRRAGEGGDSGNAANFGAALLQQVTHTGARIKSAIENAIHDLQQATAAALLDEARACSALAIDIMDRNLYERANDCRWWALDGTLRRALEESSPAATTAAAEVLAHINSLYTVYASILLLDAKGRIVAASEPGGQARVGELLSFDWVRPALQLPDGQSYTRSHFEASPLYGDRMTYIYAAALPCAAGKGAVAIVFDAAPQFEAMLRDTLPLDASGATMPQATGLFVTRAGLIVASTDPQAFPIGGISELHGTLRPMARGGSRHWVLSLNGSLYAAGASMSRGYREYNCAQTMHDDDVACIVLIRVGAVHTETVAKTAPIATAHPGKAPRASAPHHALDAGSRQLASFYCAGELLALDAEGVVEALDVGPLTQLPGSPASVAGVMMHANEAVTVLDLRALRHAAPRGAADAPAPVILCKTGTRRTFGLRVDDLGAVLDIAAAAIRPLEGYLAQHDRLAEGVMSLGSGADGSMLTLLSVRALANEFGARTALA